MEPSSASTPRAPAAGPVDYEAERKAAEWVLSVGGALNTIDESGAITWAGPSVKLESGFERVSEGKTCLAEVLRVAGDAQNRL